MIEDCLDIFMKKYEDDPEIVLKNYTPEIGDYYFININTGEIEGYMEIKKAPSKKKNKKSEQEIEDIDDDVENIIIPNSDIAREFIKRDYMSVYLNVDKAVGQKQIHSNNYLTLFVKKELSDDPDKSSGTSLAGAIPLYYEALKKIGPVKNSVDTESTERLKEIEKVEKWVSENYGNFRKMENYHAGKANKYLKIFFVNSEKELIPDSTENIEALDNMRKESDIYLSSYIFIKDIFNKKAENTTYGFPLNNTNAAVKKPYILNLKRKNKAPYMISIGEASKHKLFFDYLYGNAGQNRVNAYIGTVYENGKEKHFMECYKDSELDRLNPGFTGYYLRIKKGQSGTVVQNFNIITTPLSNAESNICTIRKHIVMKASDKQSGDYGMIKKRSALINIVDQNLYGGRLFFDLNKEITELKNDGYGIKEAILDTASLWKMWLYGMQENLHNEIFKKTTLDLLVRLIRVGNIGMLPHAYNIRKSVFFNNNNKKEINMWDSLKQKVTDGTKEPLQTGEDFGFAVGQLWKYLISLSKSGDKKYDMMMPVLDAGNVKRVKMLTTAAIQQYAHAIYTGNSKVNNLISLVMLYDGEQKPDKEMIIAGFASESIIYLDKNKKQVTKENNNE